MPGKKEDGKSTGKEVKDYGYGGVTTTNYLTGKVNTRIFTGKMDANGNSPFFDVDGRGPW